MEGPALLVVPTAAGDEMNNRNAWMMQRLGLAQSLYGGPPPAFPLAYNHWYAKGFDVDAAFLHQQIEAMSPYGFNAFIVDAGWYEHIGDWEASEEKFQPYELERMLHKLKAQGITAGLWSCPQFESANGDNLPLFVDDPPSFEAFLDAYLLDLSGEEFDQLLPGHVRRLRKRFSMGWWKYDQAFFAADSRAGAMRNVVTFQNGLRATRQANPDLTIENCQSGGRMLNELTLLATQISWLRDSNDSGFSHARQNISVGLGALEFVFPWSAFRWTNTFDKMDADDDELTRLYCRSAMAGVWGISSDLTKISDRQRAVILSEIENYRRLNVIKQSCWYDLQLPDDNADVAAVTFYNDQGQQAGILMYRWNHDGAFDQHVLFPKLNSKTKYQVTDVDTGVTTKVRGKSLKTDGMMVSFSRERQSALLFIEPAN
jgi:alpha-galactosidase